MTAQLEQIARMAAKEAVAETFLALGVDIRTPAGVIAQQEDNSFVRTSRLTLRKLRYHAMAVGVGLLVTAIGSACWLAVKAAKAAGIAF